MADKYDSIADKVKIWDCGPDLARKPTREIAALHAFKKSFVNDLEKLYKVWGHEATDEYIRPILHKL